MTTVGPDSLITTLGVRMYENKVVAGVRSNMFAGQKRVSDTALHTDGSTTVDLFAKYALSPDATLHLNIDNLFDKDYRKYPNQSDSPGMTARVGLTMRFGR